jgi:hypothetical protein
LSNNQSNVIKGDILIGSATIVGFFGFGSFVAMRLRGSSIGRQGRLMQLVYVSNLGVIISHLFVIYSIVIFNELNSIFYTAVIINTVIGVAVIAGAIAEITGLQVRDAILEASTVDRLHMVAERLRRLEQESIDKEKTTKEQTGKTTKGKTEGVEKKSPI